MGEKDIKNSTPLFLQNYFLLKVAADVLIIMPRKTEKNEGNFSALIVTVLL